MIGPWSLFTTLWWLIRRCALVEQPEGDRAKRRIASHTLRTEVWEMVRQVLLPGKESRKGESYKPLSLFSPVANTFAVLLLPSIRESHPAANHEQHCPWPIKGILYGQPCHTVRGCAENYPPGKFEILDNQLYVLTKFPKVRRYLRSFLTYDYGVEPRRWWHMCKLEHLSRGEYPALNWRPYSLPHGLRGLQLKISAVLVQLR